MFVVRSWRTNMLGDCLSRISRYGIPMEARQLTKPLYLLKVCTKLDKSIHNSYTTFAVPKCWNCHTIINTKPCLFCKNCSLIQSPKHQNFNYFELFNIRDQYNIDTGQLTTNFRKLQYLIHPDKFSNKTEEEKILSESFSSLLNKAYATLNNPLQRGFYVLKIRGFCIEEDSITMDSNFLSEIMEWNEQVEEANTKESLESLKMDINDILVDLYKELSKAFSENKPSQAKCILSKAKFYSTLLEKIKEINVY